MKFESDPPRLDEDDASELGRLVRLQSSQKMTSATSERIASRLAAAGAFAGTASATADSPRRLVERVGGAKVVALALVGLGGALFAWQTRSSELVPLPPPSAPPVAVGTPVSTTLAAPAPPSETPSIAVEALPSSVAAASAPTHAVPPRPASSLAMPVPPSASADARTPEIEFGLIRRAQAALASDPSRTLAIVDEHAQAFPAGEFVQERELSAVEALARLGRKAEARSRAGALLTRFPRTPYVARLERAIGEPLSPAGTAR